jgi:hypothetical protein
VLKTHDFLDILDLLILHDLIVLRLTHVEKFPAQREDAKVVTADDTKSSHSEGLGRVSFGQNKRALRCLTRSSVVCVGKLCDTSKTAENLELKKKRNKKRSLTGCAWCHPSF